MSLERWAQIEELFYSALKHEPAGRAAFLAAACGEDRSLQMKVESLLAADDQAGSFLQGGPERAAVVLGPGCRLGAYEIIGLIGRGGMGEVYRAHDSRLGREVAIKVLPSSAPSDEGSSCVDQRSASIGTARVPSDEASASAGQRSASVETALAPSDEGSASSDQRLGTPETARGGSKNSCTVRNVQLDAAAAFQHVLEREMALRRRFENEARLTAKVQHPAVVPIYERGQLADGRPFYAMKLITGRSLRELIDARTALADRMALLPNVIVVAEALGHAHWQRIVHRDVKPSNIIVGEFGETVLIDWGLAKNLANDAEGARAVGVPALPDRTALGTIVGTPAYMSPEQAMGLPIDERADVFSLGATLYHLLVGRAPYEGDTPAILPSVKRGNYVPLTEEHPEIPTELAAIVNKAMAPEPAQRYPTARELAEELRRFQAGQLVFSHRYSARELLFRWARRHRTLLLASAVFIAIAAVGAAISVRGILTERDRANRESEASQRVSQFMTEMFRVSDPSEARGNNITAREILDKAARQIESGLNRDPGVQARLMDTMSVVYDNLGLFAKARPFAEKSVEVKRKLLGPEHLDTLRAMNNLAVVERHQGDRASAARIHRQVLDVRGRVLGPEHPETLRSMNNLAILEREQGNYAAAEKVDRQVLEIQRRVLGPEHADTLRSMHNLAVDEGEQGHFAAAEQLQAEVLGIRRRLLGPEHLDTLKEMNNLAESKWLLGRYVEAEKLHREVFDVRRRVLGPEHPDTLLTMMNIANAAASQGRYDEAEKLHQHVLDLRRRVLGPSHPQVALSLYHLGRLALLRGDRKEAVRYLREAVDHGLSPGDAMQMHDAEDLKPLRDDPTFEALVADAKARGKSR